MNRRLPPPRLSIRASFRRRRYFGPARLAEAVLGFLGFLVGLLILLTLTTVAMLKISPKPAARIMRRLFDVSGYAMNEALAPLVPQGISHTRGISYAGDGAALLEREQQQVAGDTTLDNTTLDVFLSPTASAERPTVVWIHGGGWISGATDRICNYLKIVAGAGYNVVSIDYSLAPGTIYPTQVHQVLTALKFVSANRATLGLLSSRIVLAGDSAGAHLASQLATIITQPDYAKKFGVPSPMPATELAATVLYCGAYNLESAREVGPVGEFMRSILWAYTGKRTFWEDPQLMLASTLQQVDSRFPATFISAGNADVLAPQSVQFAHRLTELGVSVDELFFSRDFTPRLPHEYQFVLDTPAGQDSFDRMIGFLDSLTKDGVHSRFEHPG